jgi:Condensation domain
LDSELAAEAAQPFDLFTAPLARFRVWTLGAAEHVLSVTMHHSILDGLSAELLQRELATAYAAATIGMAPASDPLPLT